MKFAFRIFLSFKIESMSADRELQELLREFEETGLQNIFSHPPTSIPHEVTPPAPTQPMQTWSTNKKFKPKVHSKQNEDRHKQLGQTSKDPGMNLPGSEEIPLEGDEDIAP